MATIAIVNCYCFVLFCDSDVDCICIKVKVLSVHWSKSRQSLVVHDSSKVINENTLNKIPVFLCICLFAWFPRKVAHDSRKSEGIIMRSHILIRCLLTYVYSYITFLYFDPEGGFGEGALMEII